MKGIENDFSIEQFHGLKYSITVSQSPVPGAGNSFCSGYYFAIEENITHNSHQNQEARKSERKPKNGISFLIGGLRVVPANKFMRPGR